MKFNTGLVHNGIDAKKSGSTLPAIYQNSAFKQETASELEGVFNNKKMGYCYTRVANPTITDFENRITKLEGGAASIATSSGMAALTIVILGLLQSGDEIISSSSLYGGTIDLLRDLEAYGITTKYVTNNNWEEIDSAFTDNTRLVFAETIGNPKLDVTDVKRLADIAHSHNVPLIMDNTTATPYLIKVLDYGADIVVNSSSKYINGSGNSISGILTDSGRFKWDKDKYPVLEDYVKYGPMALIAKLRNSLFRDIGVCLAPTNAYLNILGLETLGLRMDRECSNAYKLALYLQENYKDITVNYPGLVSSPYHEIATSQLSGGFGAILTMRVGSKKRAFALIDALKLPFISSNVGDTKTLIIHPSSTLSAHSSDEEKVNAGVYDDLVRVSVGIEDIDDLIEDFDNAFNVIDK